MRQTRLIRPDYAGRFACIGPACEDTCCAGWSVSVDEAAYRKYTSLPAGPLRSLIDVSILPAADGSEKPGASPSASVRMLPSGECPFLSSERLCRIQVEHGESYLCRTCANYPRTTHTIDGLAETSLTLSCPEAARLVLLEPHLLPPAGAPGHCCTWDETKDQGVLKAYFWPIREFVLTLIKDRRYSLWQRLFLLGTFSRRLDALVRGEVKRSFPDMLSDFSRAIDTRGLSSAMASIPADLPLQLEVVLLLIVQRTSNAPVSSRLREVLSMFVKGIGYSPQASTDSLVARYADSHAGFFAPFFLRHEYILENYLINAVLRDLFPFGQKLFEPDAKPEPARAFAMLAIQFALIKGLTIGVAGARGPEFCSADVVRTVQPAVKHFEHYGKFLLEAHAMLAAKGLDNARGLTMLLRN
ncbi:MAG: flagellin lysine-N-methylase [Terracidiphilus sp.]